jgi:non-heme chloroperoxidase
MATLVIHGDDDCIVPFSVAGQRTARLVKGARLVVVKGGPHCITWTHTEEVNAALFNFFGEKNVAPA